MEVEALIGMGGLQERLSSRAKMAPGYSSHCQRCDGRPSRCACQMPPSRSHIPSPPKSSRRSPNLEKPRLSLH